MQVYWLLLQQATWRLQLNSCETTRDSTLEATTRMEIELQTNSACSIITPISLELPYHAWPRRQMQYVLGDGAHHKIQTQLGKQRMPKLEFKTTAVGTQPRTVK